MNEFGYANGIGTATTASFSIGEKQAGVPAAMADLQKRVEEGLELACKLEDKLARVLLPPAQQGEAGQVLAQPRNVSPLTDEVETVAGKVDALNSRLQYVLSRLDV